jgi:hypothetical protein
MKRTLIAVILIFLISGAGLSVATIYVAINYGKANLNGGENGLTIVAEKLTEKPQTYFTLSNPDAYVSQAISNPGECIIIGDGGNSQIKKIANTHGSGSAVNIEFNSHFYHIDLLSSDPPSIITLDQIMWIITGWSIWGSLAIATAIILLIQKILKKTAV